MAFVKPTFHLKINNPERIFFDGDVYSLSSKNNSGPFDILPNHAHFVSLLNNVTITVHQSDDKQVSYTINRGLISANQNKVRIFVDL